MAQDLDQRLRQVPQIPPGEIGEDIGSRISSQAVGLMEEKLISEESIIIGKEDKELIQLEVERQ